MTIAIFCGSRYWQDPDPIRAAISALPENSVIIHGAQRGADTIADKVAKELKFEAIPVEANWQELGKAAGSERNSRMLALLKTACNTYHQPARCFSFHEEPSLGRGTYDMVVKCIRAKVHTDVWVPVGHDDWIRVDHLMECKICRRPYINHPLITSGLGPDQIPFLNWVCNPIGNRPIHIVKL
jgi:hypothetical protein